MVRPVASSRGRVVRGTLEEVIKLQDGRLGGSPWYHLGVEVYRTHPPGIKVIPQTLIPKFEDPPGPLPFKLGLGGDRTANQDK